MKEHNYLSFFVTKQFHVYDLGLRSSHVDIIYDIIIESLRKRKVHKVELRYIIFILVFFVLKQAMFRK